ncbi:membrane protein [Corynebacterium marinum]|uniref:Uncharacterized protein n=2 Tax=Corynebacterium marinum TaxID=349751 RepID=A0A0B6TLR3_9CORY|nr:membrane protein [Corynebacterium marinum]AJK68843.1 hypothetical protein B840_06185 [Corynebacterium marinum DSM 44953]NLF91775.1 hypothetical protein [Corynebacterium marinum]GGO21159.1 hypothetical protein GCM10010980_22090 [Corynebacterium marinum]
MTPARMIPMIWLRLIVILGFGIFVAWQGHWFVGVIAGVMVLASAGQLWYAYRQRDAE